MRTAAIIAFLSLASATAATAETISVSHARGVAEFDAPPKTVVVFDLAALDILDALGVAVAAAPKGNRPDYLQDQPQDERIGTVFEPNLEALAAAAPDLIIVGGRSGPKYDAVSQIAPTLDLTIDRSDYLGSVRRNVEQLATLFGKAEAGAAALAGLDAEMAALRERSAGAGPALMVLTTGGRMSAHGPNGRFGVLFDQFGFEPAATGLDTGNHGQAISNEFILETAPEWLLVLDRDAAIGREGHPARAMLDNELVRRTPAWSKGQVVFVNPARWYLVGAGVQAIRENAHELSEALAEK